MARIRTGTTPRATKPKTTLRATNATEKMTAMVDLETIHQAAFGAFWLTRASSSEDGAPHLRVSPSSVVRRALDFYMDHLESLQGDRSFERVRKAQHDEFKAVVQVNTRKALDAENLKRLSQVLQAAQDHCEAPGGLEVGQMAASLPASWQDLRTGSTRAQRLEGLTALEARADALMPKKYQPRSGAQPA